MNIKVRQYFEPKKSEKEDNNEKGNDNEANSHYQYRYSRGTNKRNNYTNRRGAPSGSTRGRSVKSSDNKRKYREESESSNDESTTEIAPKKVQQSNKSPDETNNANDDELNNTMQQ